MKKYMWIIIASLLVLLSVLGLILFFNNKKASTSYDYEMISGKSFVLKDNSYIVFNEDKTFIWYKTKEDLEDNYYKGKYTVYRGENAIKYITNDLSIYTVSEQEQRAFLDNNKDINIDMYFNINLINKEQVINKEKEKIDRENHFYGYSNSEYNYFTLISMDTSNYAYLTLDK